MSEEYKQFGEEWEREISKNPKKFLVTMIKNVSIKYNKLKEQSTILSMAFVSCGNQIEDMKNCHNCDVKGRICKTRCKGCKRSMMATTSDNQDNWLMDKYS